MPKVEEIKHSLFWRKLRTLYYSTIQIHFITQKYTFQEGIWKWTRTGKLVEFTAWCSSQPDNGGNNNEHCLHLWGWYDPCDFKWNDIECFRYTDLILKPVCQTEI